MKIPKQLQGKKAEKFEDWVVSFITPEIEAKLANYGLWIIYGSVGDFYRQPFTPELIELFEGWTKQEGFDEILLYNREQDKEILFEKEHGEKLLYIEDLVVRPQPQTFADFIACCINSGIELTFKEQK